MLARSMLSLPAIAAALLLPSLTGQILPDGARAALVGLGLLLMPGDTVARALGLTRGGLEQRFALAFTFSLALLVPGLAIALLSGATLGVVVAVLLGLCAVAATAPAVLRRRRCKEGERAASTCGDEIETEAGPDALLVAVTVLTAAALTLAAVAVTRTGSVDRWWYLGYVQAWMNGPLTVHEPFLGSGFVQPRFAFHAWLGALAIWAECARVDPSWLWDRACPALLMPLTFAAQAMLGRALFRSRRAALLTALAAGLLCAGGGPIAGLTRLPEDKVLAALVLAPVLWAASVRACETGGTWVAASALAAIALATIHPLGFVLSAWPSLAYALLAALRQPTARSNVAALVFVLAAASAYPLASGWTVRGAYVADGAAGLAADHPVARVHRSRQRLLDLGTLGYAVDPRLLAQPVALVALAGIPLLLRRRPRERAFLAPAAILPLAVAFVPPLAAAAGTVVLPWMVHRVLWVIPLGALAAVTADETARKLRGRAGIAGLLLIALALPSARSAALARTRDEREALRLPDSPALHATLAAVRALPRGSLLAAAPELSERIPGLTGVRVLAMSDRATVVFAGSREAGEARLRQRAAVFAGVWKQTNAVPAPTHLLYAPDSPAERYCAHELLRNEDFVLCGFGPVAVTPGIRMPEVGAAADGADHIGVASLLGPRAADEMASGTPARAEHATARCLPAPRIGVPSATGLTRARPGPWSAEFPSLSCSVETTGAPLLPRTLLIGPSLGTAAEELTVQATGFGADGQVRWRVRARRRAANGDLLRFGLPNPEVERVLVEITPSFLPFVKLRTFELTVEPLRGTS